jgi:predicted short-subunit dehydrogenase-like oxidoreductase (DUF2520 family)
MNPPRKKRSTEFQGPSVDLPIFIVGGGRVGLSLAQALAGVARSGITVLRRSLSSTKRSNITIRSEGRSRQGDPIEVAAISSWRPPPSPGVIFFAVPDDIITNVALVVSGCFQRRPCPGWVALHTSGLHDATILAPLAERGLAPGSWHPLQTFPNPAPERFRGITIVVEGHPAAVSLGQAVATVLGARPMELPSALKPLYHCLSTICSSHLGAMFLFVHEALAKFPARQRRQLWEGWLNLALATLANMKESDPQTQITGPAARSDRQTIAVHRELLVRMFPEWQSVYELMDDFLRDRLANRH